MKQSSLLKQMAQYFGWGLSLLGAEFVRGQDCQGPSLSGVEMSWNLTDNSRQQPTTTVNNLQQTYKYRQQPSTT